MHLPHAAAGAPTYTGADGSQYRLYPDARRSHADAERLCADVGAGLAGLASADDAWAALSYLGTGCSLWASDPVGEAGPSGAQAGPDGGGLCSVLRPVMPNGRLEAADCGLAFALVCRTNPPPGGPYAPPSLPPPPPQPLPACPYAWPSGSSSLLGADGLLYTLFSPPPPLPLPSFQAAMDTCAFLAPERRSALAGYAGPGATPAERAAVERLCTGCGCWVNDPLVGGQCPLLDETGVLVYGNCYTPPYSYVCKQAGPTRRAAPVSAAPQPPCPAAAHPSDASPSLVSATPALASSQPPAASAPATTTGAKPPTASQPGPQSQSAVALRPALAPTAGTTCLAPHLAQHSSAPAAGTSQPAPGQPSAALAFSLSPCPAARPQGIALRMGADGLVYTLYSSPPPLPLPPFSVAQQICSYIAPLQRSTLAAYNNGTEAERAVVSELCSGCGCWVADGAGAGRCSVLGPDGEVRAEPCDTPPQSFVCKQAPPLPATPATWPPPPLLPPAPPRRPSAPPGLSPCPAARPQGIALRMGADGLVYTLYSSPPPLPLPPFSVAQQICSYIAPLQRSTLAAYNNGTEAERAVVSELCSGCGCWVADGAEGGRCSVLGPDGEVRAEPCDTPPQSFVCKQGFLSPSPPVSSLSPPPITPLDTPPPPVPLPLPPAPPPAPTIPFAALPNPSFPSAVSPYLPACLSALAAARVSAAASAALPITALPPAAALSAAATTASTSATAAAVPLASLPAASTAASTAAAAPSLSAAALSTTAATPSTAAAAAPSFPPAAIPAPAASTAAAAPSLPAAALSTATPAASTAAAAPSLPAAALSTAIPTAAPSTAAATIPAAALPAPATTAAPSTAAPSTAAPSLPAAALSTATPTAAPSTAAATIPAAPLSTATPTAAPLHRRRHHTRRRLTRPRLHRRHHRRRPLLTRHRLIRHHRRRLRHLHHRRHTHPRPPPPPSESPCPAARPSGVASIVGDDGLIYTLFSPPAPLPLPGFRSAMDMCAFLAPTKRSALASFNSSFGTPETERVAVSLLCTGCGCWVNDDLFGGTCPILTPEGAVVRGNCFTPPYSYVCKQDP
ncbi:hypothetical protein HYH03_017054 [Edaphochlamys debaryana]|uniref:C-type lectin domain-containing protein n=1 Tax=Edaphochlamys debaryana TaxID=47281 RepID=A0A835XJ45_9CHLO|nr:hypothetical protein HYH03_017054 [Edaphochlamys debaryana]|eukprot:KAG2484102.1 hypothetical protein HYH03_017054 [Edaphochlamys debaryana]